MYTTIAICPKYKQTYLNQVLSIFKFKNTISRQKLTIKLFIVKKFGSKDQNLHKNQVIPLFLKNIFIFILKTPIAKDNGRIARQI
jgi:hypothetical protein